MWEGGDVVDERVQRTCVGQCGSQSLNSGHHGKPNSRHSLPAEPSHQLPKCAKHFECCESLCAASPGWGWGDGCTRESQVLWLPAWLISSLGSSDLGLLDSG